MNYDTDFQTFEFRTWQPQTLVSCMSHAPLFLPHHGKSIKKWCVIHETRALSCIDLTFVMAEEEGDSDS